VPTLAREPSPAAPSVTPASIAIVIDDLGNDREALERIARWPFRVAGAVLPGLPDSADAARRLAASGKEVLLHLPMEPDGYPRVRPGPGVVLRADSDEKIAQTVAGGSSTRYPGPWASTTTWDRPQPPMPGS
jgi:polysaccharide deacetylase 2 family uncharacterized protein YibQ